MSAKDKPYSDAAIARCHEVIHELWLRSGVDEPRQVEAGFEAAHDREALGLDASVHAASYRREVIEEVAAELKAHTRAESWHRAADFLLREFKATEAKP